MAVSKQNINIQTITFNTLKHLGTNIINLVKLVCCMIVVIFLKKTVVSF